MHVIFKDDYNTIDFVVVVVAVVVDVVVHLLIIAFLNINCFSAELGTRQHCHDNVTMFLGHKFAQYSFF